MESTQQLFMGICDVAALKILTETGTNLSKRASEKHFVLGSTYALITKYQAES